MDGGAVANGVAFEISVRLGFGVRDTSKIDRQLPHTAQNARNAPPTIMTCPFAFAIKREVALPVFREP